VNGNQVVILETYNKLANSYPYSKIRTIEWTKSQQVDFAYVGALPPGGGGTGGGGASLSDPSSLADGVIAQEQGSEAYYVLAGGAKYHIDWAEWQTLGGAANMPTLVPAGSLASFPSVPTRLVFLRESTDPFGIYQVIGGAKYHLSEAEWQALISADQPAAAVTVPTGFINQVTGTVPQGIPYLRDVQDSYRIYQVVGGMKYALSEGEYTALGSPAALNTVSGFLASIVQSTPADGTIIRDSSAPNAVYQVVGASRYHLSQAELDSLGGPSRYVTVPTGLINQVPATLPVDGTYVRDLVAPNPIYQVLDGVKVYMSATEYAARGFPAATNVTTGFLSRMPSVDPVSSFVRDPASGAIYQVVGWARYHLSPAEHGSLGSPASVNVPSAFVARLGAIPADGSVLREPSAPYAIYVMAGGKKVQYTPESYAAAGWPGWVTLPAGWLAQIPTA
jgi:hypothetical protein